MSGSGPEWVSFAQFGASIVTWFLVVVGWLVISDQQDRREVSKNAYGRFLALRSQLEAIERDAVAHHTTAFQLDRVRSILRSISSVATEISHLRRLGFLDSSCVTAVLNYRAAITINNFDQSSYQALSLSNQLVTEIEIRRDAVERKLFDAEFSVVTKPRTLRKSVAEAFRHRFW